MSTSALKERWLLSYWVQLTDLNDITALTGPELAFEDDSDGPSLLNAPAGTCTAL